MNDRHDWQQLPLSEAGRGWHECVRCKVREQPYRGSWGYSTDGGRTWTEGKASPCHPAVVTS